jgi:hypothetical protein
LITLFTVAHSDFSKELGDYINLADIAVFIVYAVPIFLFFYFRKRKNVEINPAYKYFISGYGVKILFSLIFTFIYLFYYEGGDAIAYFWSSRAMSNLLLVNPKPGLSILIFNHRTWENWSYFNSATTIPMGRYYFAEGDSFSVVRFTSLFMIPAFNLWLPSLLLLNIYLYRGIWKFFLLVCKFYPENMKWNAVCILFIPSVLFWGSGIMKDSYTLAASLWLVTNLYYCFIERRKFLNNFIMLIINSYILITLKPYIFVAIIPAALVWVSFIYIKKIKSNALKILAGPGLLTIGALIGLLVLRLFSSSLGKYGDTDSMLKQAQVVQQDLVRGVEYGQNYYDIGKFDPTISGVLKKAPVALIAGLYRPFLWEARNPVMLISGLENFAILILSLYIILRIGIKSVYKVIIKEPLIIFSFIFAFIFSFSVGLASANFGALVRYRILATPFFLIALVNTYFLTKKAKKEEEIANQTVKKPLYPNNNNLSM